MEFTIRKATATDCQAMHGLILELAIYEEAPQEFTLSLADFTADGFGENPIYSAFVAHLATGEIVGFALYYEKYSTWKGRCIYLEDLYVKQAYRKFGLGERLFTQVAQVAAEGNYGRMEWQVLFWNSPALGFYRKHGATLDNDWVNGKFTAEQLRKFKG
ncbi:MAG: N-acetyltransferase family protein [Luteibaculaceae bacterium]